MAASFEYARPKSTKDALALLQEHGPAARVLAGGVILVPMIRRRLIRPAWVISLRDVRELRFISAAAPGHVTIGALTTLRELDRSPLLAPFSALAEAVHGIGTRQVQNQGTAGGNLCQADPAGDLAPALIAFSGTVSIAGAGGQREMPLEHFFTAPYATALGERELLSEIRIAPPAPGSGSAYVRFTLRRGADRAIAGVAVALVAREGRCLGAGIGVAGGRIPLRASAGQAALIGQPLDESTIRNVARAVAAEVDPPGDLDASADYRRALVEVLCARAVRTAAERARARTA